MWGSGMRLSGSTEIAFICRVIQMSFMCILLLVFLTLFSLTPLSPNVVTYSDKKQLKEGKGRFSLQLQVTIHHLRQDRKTCLIFHMPLLPTKELISSPKKYSWNHGGCCLLGGLYTQLSFLGSSGIPA